MSIFYGLLNAENWYKYFQLMQIIQVFPTNANDSYTIILFQVTIIIWHDNHFFANSYIVFSILNNTNNFQSSIWSIAETQTGSTSPGQSWRRSNGNKLVLYAPQSPRIEALPADTVLCYFKMPWREELCSSVWRYNRRILNPTERVVWWYY